MKKIIVFLFTLTLLVSCNLDKKAETTSSTGSTQTPQQSTRSDKTDEGSGQVFFPKKTINSSQNTPTSSIPPTQFGTGNTSPVVSEKTEQEMEEFVDEANAEIEALIEEMFQADGNK